MEEMNLQENEQLAEMISEAVADSNMSDQIDVSFTSQYVLLTMKGALLFDSGSDALKKESMGVLDKVAVILEKYAAGEIEINGHTDNVPIRSARFADNEELSSARALSVFYYLVNNSTLDATKIKHAGMGERVPIADNSTEEGRAKNRRVEIRIYNASK
jgi:chemotaxis protein MotB